MKKLLALLLAAAFTFSVAAVAQDTGSGEKKGTPAATTEKKEAKAEKKAAKKEAKAEKKEAKTKKAAKKEAKEKKAEEKK